MRFIRFLNQLSLIIQRQMEIRSFRLDLEIRSLDVTKVNETVIFWLWKSLDCVSLLVLNENSVKLNCCRNGEEEPVHTCRTILFLWTWGVVIESKPKRGF